jgi:hypothetical protein
MQIQCGETIRFRDSSGTEYTIVAEPPSGGPPRTRLDPPYSYGVARLQLVTDVQVNEFDFARIDEFRLQLAARSEPQSLTISTYDPGLVDYLRTRLANPTIMEVEPRAEAGGERVWAISTSLSEGQASAGGQVTAMGS